MSQASPAGPASAADGMPSHDDARKLTIYFGERAQAPSGAYVADQLLDLFGRHEVATSILLRGIEGFGIKHHVRSDRSLTLSEDPPMVAVAVDSTPRIEALLDEVGALRLRGLVTVERASLIRPSQGSLGSAQNPHEQVKLTVYIGREERVNRTPAFVAVCDLMHRAGLAGASAFLGVDGTSDGARHRAAFFGRNSDVPMMIIAVGDGHRIAEMIPELRASLRHPLLTVERVTVCKRDGVLAERPPALPSRDAGGLAVWQKLMVYTSESTLHRGAPIHRAVVRRLRAAGIARGSTVIRGFWGFHGDHRPHGDRFLQVQRRVPVGTIVIDEPDRIAQSFDLIDELTAEHGLVTSEMVPALLSAQPGRRHGGFQLARQPY